MGPMVPGVFLVLLSQDDFENPLIKYFSYIALGLVMCIGYVIFRVQSQRKKRQQAEKRSLEAMLVEAEAEARALKEKREAGVEEDEEDVDVLAMSPEQLREQARLRQMVRDSEQDSDKQEQAGEKEPQ